MAIRRSSLAKNFLHGLALRKFIDEFVQLPDLLHQWILDRLHAHATDDAVTGKGDLCCLYSQSIDLSGVTAMADTRETVVSWLRDAHAMEAAAVDNIEKNIDRFEEYPTVQQVFREDLEVSRRNSKELETVLDRLGADRSTLKDMGMKFASSIQPLVAGAASDDVIKHMLAAQAYKHFEVASFRSLSTAAETIGDSQIKDLCDRSVEEKKRLAARFEENLPQVTREYLARVH
jgi:ferritin-like metal-binding protein YciE